MGIKILHTGDVHLGARFSYLAEHSAEQRNQVRNTFAGLVNTAKTEGVALVLIAGDLFDSPFPAAADIVHVQQVFKELLAAGIKIAVIPGNHDRLEAGSVFAGNVFAELETKGLHIFRETKVQVWEIPELHLAVYASATKERISKKSPLEGLQADSTLPVKVGLFHGSVDIAGEPANAPILKEKLGASGLNYVALGDWHSTLDVSSGKVSAWYSGSPEMLQPDQGGAGQVLITEIDTNGKVQVRQVKAGLRRSFRQKVAIDSGVSLLQVIEQLKQHVALHDFVTLQLEGKRSLTNSLDIDELQKQAGQLCFYVKVSDKSVLEISSEALAAYPESTVLGRYIRALQAKKGKSPEQDAIIDEAIQLGASLLTATQ